MVTVSLSHLIHWGELLFSLVLKAGGARRGHHYSRPHASLDYSSPSLGELITVDNLVGLHNQDNLNGVSTSANLTMAASCLYQVVSLCSSFLPMIKGILGVAMLFWPHHFLLANALSHHWLGAC